MSSLRPESHVAQQIRRDKLRVQNNITSSSYYSQSLEEFPNNTNLEQQQLSLDLLQVRNVRNNANNDMLPNNDPSLIYSSSSQVPHFQSSSPLFNPNHQEQQLGAAAEPSRLIMNQFGNLGNWRIGNNGGSNQAGCDWFLNYASSSMPNNNESISPNTALLPSQLNNNVSHNQHYMKPSYNELTDAQSSLNREIQRQLGVMHHHHHHSSSSSSAFPLYQNALQDIVKSASISAQGSLNMASIMQQTGHGIWVGDAGGQLDLHPSYVNQPNHVHPGSGNPWTTTTAANRTVENAPRWSSPLGFTDKKDMSDSNPQSLSLSLSSNAQSKTCVSQFEEGSASDDLQSAGCGVSNNKDLQNMKYVKSSFMKPQDTMVSPSSTTSYKNVGPLGPFTGYATILKSSRFLKSAQVLLDEFCRISSPKSSRGCDASERVSEEVSASTTSADAVTVSDAAATKGGSNSGSSSSMLYGANENNADWGTGSGSCISPRPDFQQKKARLLLMQEEVTRRYKQYHQQMQMVVSSFQSVAGLSSSTPYISLALRSVSRHFRFLKSSISDQLKHISEALGEDFSIPSTSSNVDASMGRLRCMDQSIQKNKPGRGSTGLIEPPQHAWRSQRGLPESAVAILKAWLFEHFLHPYPTDTDKHMLANQTGLSRNQVSNWFINARVRVWKPMVEEIHMLETKGTPPSANNQNQNSSTRDEDGTNTNQQPRIVDHKHLVSKFGMMQHSMIPENQSNNQYMEMDTSVASNADEENGFNAAEQWSQEKRSKLECHTTSIDNGPLMGFVPYRRGSGLGSVSLTLGLRHGVEGVQQKQQQQLQEEQLRRQFGGHMIHDFVG